MEQEMAEKTMILRTGRQSKTEPRPREDAAKKEKLGKHTAIELVLSEEILRLMKAL
jgi:hypothetical protein